MSETWNLGIQVNTYTDLTSGDQTGKANLIITDDEGTETVVCEMAEVTFGRYSGYNACTEALDLAKQRLTEVFGKVPQVQ